MPDEYVIENGHYGPRLIVKSSWSLRILKIAQQHDVRELELNYAKGWKGDDLSFLNQVRFLKSFEIIDWKIDDVSPIHTLTELQSLKVSTYCKTGINFDQFPHLEECVLEWRPKASSIFERTSLKRVFINKYPGKDMTKFRSLTALERLSLASPKIETLNGIEALRRLNFFGVYEARKLQSISGVETLSDLTVLEVNGCRRIKDVAPVSGLIKLRELHLCNMGDIDSIKPLSGLINLEKFFFYESTNILDGDLSPLKQLNKLNTIAFQARRHYSHASSDFP